MEEKNMTKRQRKTLLKISEKIAKFDHINVGDYEVIKWDIEKQGSNIILRAVTGKRIRSELKFAGKRYRRILIQSNGKAFSSLKFDNKTEIFKGINNVVKYGYVNDYLVED